MISLMMILNLMPWQEVSKAFALTAVTKVELLKRYVGNYNVPDKYLLTVYGTDLANLEVQVQNNLGEYNPLSPSFESNTLVQYAIDVSLAGSKFQINGEAYDIIENDMPQIKSVTPTLVKLGGNVDVTANNLKSMYELNQLHESDPANNKENIKVRYFDVNTSINILTDAYTTNDPATKTVPIISGLGVQNVEVVKYDYSNPQPVTIQYRYVDAFRIYKDMDGIDGDIIINPNRAQEDDLITVSAENFNEGQYAIFLLEDPSDPFLGKNLGKEITAVEHRSEARDVFKFKVPGLEFGTYNVMLTNAVEVPASGYDENTRLTDQIVSQRNIGKITVVDGRFLPTIQSVIPNSGPDTGSDVKIFARYMEELQVIDGLSGFDDNPDNIIIEEVEDRNGSGIKELKINYPLDGVHYNGKPVSIVRYISVIIGDSADFQEISSQVFKSGSNIFDEISVRTKPLTDTEGNLLKDVIINIDTLILDPPLPPGTTKVPEDLSGYAGQVINIYDSATKENGYTYIPSFKDPIINDVSPNSILVENAGTGKYATKNESIIAIIGNQFEVYRYTNDANETIITYPKISLGGDDDISGEIVYEKTSQGIRDLVATRKTGSDVYVEDADIQVLTEAGELVDGTVGNETGQIILVRVPTGQEVNSPNLDGLKKSVAVSNPMRNSSTYNTAQTFPDAIRFVSTTNVPNIESVTPSTVTLDGKEEIKITGTNFDSNVEVYVNGIRVTQIRRNGVGTEITFESPQQVRPMDTIIYVLNPDTGASASRPFKYVKTYTDPKINDFNPKKGQTGTNVVVTGQNFLKSDPSADEKDILRLIGTRVLLDGNDINEYNRDEVTKVIKLENYEGPSATAYNEVGKVIRISSDDRLKVEDYYHSLILKEITTPNLFIIDRDFSGKTIITNGIDEKYIIKKIGNEIKAERDGGDTYNFAIKTESGYDYIDITDNDNAPVRKMRLTTPYKFDSATKIITGNRVRVTGLSELQFTVPILPSNGFYDLTIENPDTKKDSVLGDKGFEYFTLPNTDPNISQIDPNEGSVDGNYSVRIIGKKTGDKENFIDNGIEKTKVFFGAKEVNPDNITVSLDGTYMDVIVPPVGVDLKEEYGVSRYAVPVTVLNSDGGSSTLEEGFTYIIPVSDPQITNMIPNSGSAVGGYIVEITGKDFRFFENYEDKNRDGAWNPGEPYDDINGVKIDTTTNPISYIDDDGTMGPDNFEGISIEKLKADLGDKFNEIARPIIPRVYFGSNKAEVTEFGSSFMKVRVPSGKAQATDVLVINNDAGISNKYTFNYQSINPVIDSINPSVGANRGREKVDFVGSSFYKTNINEYYQDADKSYKTKVIETVLVRFGSITNKEIPRELENSGRVDNGRTKVELEGDLTIEYDANDTEIKIHVMNNNKEYEATIDNYDGSEVFIPLSLLKNINDEKDLFDGYELVRVYVDIQNSLKRLIIERGYSPKVEYSSKSKMLVYTPSYYTVGQVDVTVTNPDEGYVKSRFTYKNPDSKPIITNMTKDGRNPGRETQSVDGEKKTVDVLRMSYKGGSIVSVFGTDFRENAKIEIGSLATINFSGIKYELPGKLTFTMPPVDESMVGQLVKVRVINEDGAVASSADTSPPIYIMFTKGVTEPVIKKIDPDRGPTSGGVKVKIEGTDFRETIEGYDEKIKVFFGEKEVPESDIQVADYRTIYAVIPQNEAGEVDVVVENPDGERSPGYKFLYVSNPKISIVVDPADSLENTKIREIPIDGGTQVKIKGSGFMEGARVVFAPTLEAVDPLKANGQEVYIGQDAFLIKEGEDATDVTYINSETLVVTVPAGKLDSTGVMVINQDKGASEVYLDIKYVLSVIQPPSGVVAELVYDKYIKVHWNPVEGAKEYEIYVVIDDNQIEVIGSTKETSFVYEDIEPRTTYSFVVVALGDFGESKKSQESNEVKTGSSAGIEDEDGELNEKTEINISGPVAKVIIGTDDYDEELTLDLTRGTLMGAKTVEISMPAKIIAKYDSADITIIGPKYNLVLNPKAFYSSRVEEYRREDDAGVRFKLEEDNYNVDLPGNKLSVGSLSDQLIFEAQFYVGKDMSKMDYLNSSLNFTTDYDEAKARMRRFRNVTINKYDEYTNQWIPITDNTSVYPSSINTLVSEMGKYIVVGRK